ncbi:MAG: sulfite exporter TauE/SafE family protein [Pseudomonadales bacterium]|nr:sulfite exporter TauE/SafE family protein [Pseudomonadales bacterium]
MEISLLSIVVLVGALFAAGAVAGLTAGLFGNGGGFVVVPALLAVFPLFSDAYAQHIYVAVGTSLASIIVSSARSVQSHMKRNAVDFEVLRGWAPWLVIGVVGGLFIASKIDGTSLMLVFAIGVLVYSFYFLFPGWFANRSTGFSMPTGAGRAALATALGGFSSLLGIGGGTITVVTMVTCGRKVHQAVATAAGVGFIISVPGAIGFLMLGLKEHGELPFGSLGYINLPALLAVCVMSVITAPIGAKWAHSLNEMHLKRIFGLYLLGVSSTMFYKSISTF